MTTMAQTTYLPLESKEYIILERMEIKSRVDSVLNFSKTKPFIRKQMIIGALQADSGLNLSAVDQYNLQRLKLNNLEWIPGDFPGRVIEAAGLKGFRVGGAEVSPMHANYFVNTGGATAADVRGLIIEIQRRVEQEFGARLEPEVKIIGSRGEYVSSHLSS